MSALSIRANLAATAKAAAAPAAPVAAADAAFSALLGEITRPAAAPAHAPASPPGKDRRGAEAADANPSNDSTLAALQSLEAALNGFGALTPASAPAGARQAKNESSGAQAGVGAQLAATVGEAAAWDVSGAVPLKSQLQADASLGLKQFQMKTFLAATGALPMRVGAAALAPGWSPLAEAAVAEAAAVQAVEPPTRRAPPLDAAVTGARAFVAAIAPRAGAPPAGDAPAPVATARASRTAAPPPAAGAPAPAAGVAASSPPARQPPSGGPRGGDAVGDVAAAGPASSDPAPTPTVSVALVNVPDFIADQANTFAAASDPQTAAAPSGATPQAAQAVKELQIALDPADLGQMTLKLRLASGKLSVTIAVADPQTLAAIEGDRALIAARLGGGEHALGEIVIQRQVAASPQTEATPPDEFANDSGSRSSASDGQPDSRAFAGRRPSAQPRGGAGGARGGLVV